MDVETQDFFDTDDFNSDYTPEKIKVLLEDPHVLASLKNETIQDTFAFSSGDMELPKMSCMDGESGEMTISDIDAVQFFHV